MKIMKIIFFLFAVSFVATPVANAYDVYDSYDSYSGSYSPSWDTDYSSPVWTTTPDTSTSGDTNNATSGNTTTSDTSSGSSSTTTTTPSTGSDTSSSPTTSSSTTAAPVVDTRTVSDSTVITIPANTTEIYVSGGKVYNAITKVEILDARYNDVQHAIYYLDTSSSYGKMLTATRGYVNATYTTITTTTTTVSPEAAAEYYRYSNKPSTSLDASLTGAADAAQVNADNSSTDADEKAAVPEATQPQVTNPFIRVFKRIANFWRAVASLFSR